MDDPKCAACDAEAFRMCSLGCGYRCTMHPCEHMEDPEPIGSSWLSNGSVVSGMSDSQLLEARLRLATQLYAVDREISIRKFDAYRKTRRKPVLRESDLDPGSISPSNSKKATKALIKNVLGRMTPEQIADLQARLEAKLKDKK